MRKIRKKRERVKENGGWRRKEEKREKGSSEEKGNAEEKRIKGGDKNSLM